MPGSDTVTPQDASYETQMQRLIGSRRTYPVRVTPIPTGTWCLQAHSHEYRPYLFYWAMATVQDSRNPTGKSTWTLWFGFREPPMEHLGQAYHDGCVAVLAEDDGPHFLMVPGFTFDLFVGPGGAVARAEILDSHEKG